MIYKIRYNYKTGDSFGSRDEEGVLEMEWSNLDNAKEALKRIEDHYRWYEQKNQPYYYPKSMPLCEPKWHEGEEYDFVMKVKLDNGNEVQFSAPWCGYFERLYGAEIFTPAEENGMRTEF